MKVFLDDTRPAPDGWVRCYWPEEVVTLIEAGGVEVVSLDHNLGDDGHGTGYDVCRWLEQKIFEGGWDSDFIPPVVVIHSANPVGRQRMQLAINWMSHQFKVFSATKPENWEIYQQRLRDHAHLCSLFFHGGFPHFLQHPSPSL